VNDVVALAKTKLVSKVARKGMWLLKLYVKFGIILI
jgi:hypothetical protein